MGRGLTQLRSLGEARMFSTRKSQTQQRGGRAGLMELGPTSGSQIGTIRPARLIAFSWSSRPKRIEEEDYVAR
jgi:hypothetical protein